MKTLNTIQTLSKIGKILSKIVYICCIVGLIGCAVGAVAVCIGAGAVKIGGTTLHDILQTEAGVGTGTVWASIAVGIILCLGEIFVARMAYRYFEGELNAGTPFTMDGAKELKHLGISVIWIPLASIVLAQIVQEIIALCMENTETLALEGDGSIALGIMFIVASLLCKCGAELRGNEKVAPAESGNRDASEYAD